jgi:hypothetical protein
MTPRLAAALALPLSACASATLPSESGAGAAEGAAFVRIGEEARLGSLSVRALRLVEDSRCPAGVQCIQAGTVRLAVRIRERGSEREAVLRLRAPEPLSGGGTLSLASVCPPPAPPGAPPVQASYRFYLTALKPGGGIALPAPCSLG